MGDVISKAATGIGSVLGNAFVAPFKAIFNESCEDVCAGPWDFICFVEHLCVSSLIKLLMILGLCYIILLFCYLLFKVGICQCIGRSLCKICWAACETYWYALEDITCFLWHKLKNTTCRKRRHIRDIESGYSSGDGIYFSGKYRHLSCSRKPCREKKGIHHRHHHHRHGREGSRKARSLRRLQSMKVRNPHKVSKKRLLR